MLKNAAARLLFLFLLLALPAFAQSRLDCSSLPSKVLHRDVPYCVFLPQSYDTAKAKLPVLYFLHGLGDNQQSLINMGAWNLISDLRAQNKIGDFLIVTPQGWTDFYINSANGRVLYSDFFLNEFIPFIEHKYRVRTDRAGRAISGISMGGYGALRFAFAYPQKFSAVSSESAALFADSPKVLDEAMQSGAPRARLLENVFGNPINLAHWNANSPFVLAKQNASSIAHLAIYFNCGTEDSYGFNEGASALDKQLTAERVQHTFRLYPGGHTLPYFLAHMDELMEFHSREFAKSAAAK
ncbi:MAG TPA: alpha/beta hydrolase-fold protein [Candidatus Koribacter sp.]